MTKWTSMSVKDTTLERMEDHQPDDMSRDKYLNLLLDTWENEASNASQCDVSGELTDIYTELESINSTLKTLK